MRKFFDKKIIFSIISFFLVISIVVLVYGNFSVDIEEIDIYTDKLPKSFQNFTIAHISDFHNRNSKIINKQIFESLNEEKPDIIVITGDIIDTTHTKVDVALDFAKNLCEYAPVYYVTGNHESNVLNDNEVEFNKLINGLTELGIKVLRNSQEKITNSAGDSFNIYGIEDPYFYGGYEQVYQRTEILCNEFTMNENEFNILLAHHPETLSVYSKYYIDLVFSGHAHGGQVTIFGKAVVAPDQVSFPPYTSGLYKMGNTQLILSRGIGYSMLPIRVFCRSHLVYGKIKISD